MLHRIWTALAMAWEERRRLFSPTALPILAIGAVLLAAGIYGAWRVHRLNKRGAEMLSENVASIRAAKELETIAHELRHRLKRHLGSGNGRHLDHIDELLPVVGDAIDVADRLAKSARERALVRRMRHGLQRFQGDFERVLALPPGPGRDETILQLADEAIPREFLVHIDQYIELNEEQLEHSSQRNQSTANWLMFGLLLLGTCGGVTGLLAGYFIARLVNHTIVQLAIPLRDTAGKLNQVAGPVPVAAEPGFNDLELVLKNVSDHVTTVVERLQDSERDRLRAEQLAALGQLAAGLAHELRNPLTSMKAILQLSNAPSDLTQRDLGILREECERLQHSVQSLLDFARPPQLKKTATDLASHLEQTAALVRRRAQRLGIPLIYIAPRHEVRLLADAAQLRQLVLNLLLNAIDATPRGGCIRLECRMEMRQDASPADPPGAQASPAWVVIVVRDDGKGLPEELGDRIFAPFVTTKETGTGLGLSICKQIVVAHGGQLKAANRDDGGAVFEVWLPLVGAADDPNTDWPDAVRRDADTVTAKGAEL